jgi:hypothetical protein
MGLCKHLNREALFKMNTSIVFKHQKVEARKEEEKRLKLTSTSRAGDVDVILRILK